MQSPVQITFRDFPSSPALAAHIERRATKLESFSGRIVKCHVVIESPNRHSKHGPRYHVRIELVVPGKELVVTKTSADSKEDANAAVDDAFGDAERLLEEYARQHHFESKTHLKPPHGVVTKLFGDRGYGFIETEDGREIYFHQNSVLGLHFDRLAVGTRVRFAEEDGDKGPQASTVHVVGVS